MYVFDHEYFFSSVDPDERDRISKSVWKREPGGNRRRGDFSYGGKYGAAVIFCKIAEQRRKKSGIIKESRYTGKDRKSCIKNSMCKIVSAADSTGV